MASIPGGRADKLGNEFERLWTVRHLIEVLAGKALSVQVEALGADERGTEFWVSRQDGTREAHQCKRENRSLGRWTVSDLAANRVLGNAKIQLARDPKHHFYFVSGDKAPSLSDMEERARNGAASEDLQPDLFSTSRELESEFKKLCTVLDVDTLSADGRAAIGDFLRRFHVRLIDKHLIRGEVEDLASRWIEGEPKDIVPVLETFALRNETMGRRLRDVDVVAALPPDARPRDLAKDAALPARIREQNDRFEHSYRHLLISGVTLGRLEEAELWNQLASNVGPQVFLIHGPGGCGKSGIVFELVARLRANKIPVLATRLDRDRVPNSPAQFGENLGLPASPAACLATVADGDLGVLVLDQLDAIHWTTTHSPHAWQTCERLMAEAISNPNLRVVVACRSFDVNDNSQIRDWKSRANVREISVGPLGDPFIDRIVADTGLSPSSLASDQRTVLRSPQALYIWRKLHVGIKKPIEFRNIGDLMKLFWTSIRIRLTELKPGQYQAALDALLNYMDKHGLPYAPSTIVSKGLSENNLFNFS